MSEELAIRDGNDISPEDFSAAIAEAHDKAKTLKDIVESQGLSKHFGGAKAHLLVEAPLRRGSTINQAPPLDGQRGCA